MTLSFIATAMFFFRVGRMPDVQLGFCFQAPLAVLFFSKTKCPFGTVCSLGVAENVYPSLDTLGIWGEC